MRFNFILLIQFLTVVVVCDLAILSPKPNEVFSPSGGAVSIDIIWMDNQALPPVSDVKEYTIKLCTGPNDKINCFSTLAEAVPSSDVVFTSDHYTYSVSIGSSLVGDGQYFLQIYADVRDKTIIGTIHYTPRFILTSMTGVTTYTYSTTLEPPAQTNYIQGADAGNNLDTSASFTVPYTLQTGKTRFAPMQMQPNTKVTGTAWSRRFPTSAVTFYSVFRPWTELQQLSTITPGWSYTYTSGANYATPALFPYQVGSWYNPRKRMSLTPRKLVLTHQHTTK